MGENYIDQYTLLHFASGVIGYYWGMGMWGMFAIHSIYEYIENTGVMMGVIEKYIRKWPGGKRHRDKFGNSVMDTVAAMIGWITAAILDGIVEKREITVSGIMNARHKKLLNL